MRLGIVDYCCDFVGILFGLRWVKFDFKDCLFEGFDVFRRRLGFGNVKGRVFR